jgi:adenosine deaminase
MAQRNIGIEISPTCNITLGSAFSPDVLRRYVAAFLQEGVHIFLGTDDPAFLNTT